MRTRTRSVALVLFGLLTAPVLLAGCGGGTAHHGSAAPTGSAASSSVEQTAAAGTAAEDATGAPAFSANTDPDTADPSSGASVTVRDIRLSRQDGFDRVVFDVGGAGTPGWNVRYVDAASSQGSGKAIDVAGSAVLQVSITGAGYPYDTGVPEYSAHGPLTSGDTKVVTEVVFDATFEGTTTSFVGARTKAAFRVYLLQNPTRVVLEVADPS